MLFVLGGAALARWMDCAYLSKLKAFFGKD
jgi:hypothetical protein